MMTFKKVGAISCVFKEQFSLDSESKIEVACNKDAFKLKQDAILSPRFLPQQNFIQSTIDN